MINKISIILLLMLVYVISSPAQSAQNQQPESEDALPIGFKFHGLASPESLKIPHDARCAYWWAQIDTESILPDQMPKRDENDDRNVIEAIDCLLKLKGNTAKKRLTAIISLEFIETQIPPPTVEIDALYKISALYYQKWNHAAAIALLQNGGPPQKGTVKKAYQAYEAWFKKVREIGLTEARKRRLDPLAGSGIS